MNKPPIEVNSANFKLSWDEIESFFPTKTYNPIHYYDHSLNHHIDFDAILKKHNRCDCCWVIDVCTLDGFLHIGISLPICIYCSKCSDHRMLNKEKDLPSIICPLLEDGDIDNLTVNSSKLEITFKEGVLTTCKICKYPVTHNEDLYHIKLKDTAIVCNTCYKDFIYGSIYGKQYCDYHDLFH